MTGILITTDNKVSRQEYGEPLYKTVGAAVGGYIECVNVMINGKRYIMIVNEEGLLQGLPFNTLGSFLYGYYRHGTPIVGDVVIMKQGFVNGEPDIVGLDDKESKEILDAYCDMLD